MQSNARVPLIDRIHAVIPPPGDARDRPEYITRQYDTVLRAVPHGICLMTFNWQIVWVNDATNRIFRAADATAQEITGQAFALRFPGKEDFEDYTREAMKQLRMAGTDKREVQLVKTDGSLFWCEITLVRLDPSATSPGFIATLTDQTERHRAEQRLSDSEKRFRSLVQNSTDMLLVYDAEGRIAYANPAVERILGFTPEEMVGKGGYEVVHPEDLPIAKAFFRQLMANPGKKFSTEFRVTTQSGRWRHVEGVATNLLDDPIVRGIVSNSRDITERKESDLALRNSEAMYGSLVESLTQNVFRKDLSGRFEFVNSNFARLIGKPASEIVGKTDFDLFPAELAAKFQEDDLRVLRTGTPLELVEENKAPDGSRIYVQVVKTPVCNAAGKIVGLQGIFWDITERKNSEEALRQSEEQYARLINNTTDGVYEVDLAGNMRFANPALLEMIGYTAEEIRGLNNRAFMDEENSKIVFEAFNNVFRTGAGHKGLTYEILRRDGQRIAVDGSAQLIRDSHGAPVGFLGMVRDITEKRKAAQALEERTRQLERANQDLVRKNTELDEFTYIASHDLQEPLRKLTAFSDFLKKDLGENLTPRVEKDLHFIVDAASRMQVLVQDLLQLSRAGKTAITREKVDLAECARRACEALAIRIEQTGAEIQVDDLPVIWGDKTMITQLYQNLIGNALKFIEKDVRPKIQLTLEKRGDSQVFGVKDNGIGIKAEYAEQIFAPFKRLHGRDKYEGSGIGLAICRKWVERLGGTIWVESELGKGAHFLFTLGERNRGRDPADAGADL